MFSVSKFYKRHNFVLEAVKEFYESQIHKSFMSYINNFTIPEEAVLLVIDEILWLLKDGKWRSLREIIEKCSSPESKVKMSVSFLWEYDFIQMDESGRKAKLRPPMLKFVDEIQRVEREEAFRS